MPSGLWCRRTIWVMAWSLNAGASDQCRSGHQSVSNQLNGSVHAPWSLVQEDTVSDDMAIKHMSIQRAQTQSSEGKQLVEMGGYVPRSLWCRRTLWTMPWPSSIGASDNHRHLHWGAINCQNGGLHAMWSLVQKVTVGNNIAIKHRSSHQAQV